jgi:hypothetical protein
MRPSVICRIAEGLEIVQIFGFELIHLSDSRSLSLSNLWMNTGRAHSTAGGAKLEYAARF